VGKLYPRHEKQTKNPAETTGNRYKIEILMSRTQKLKGLSAASLRLKTLNDNPYIQLVRLIILFQFFSIKNAGRYANSGLVQLFGCMKDTFYRFMNNGRTLTARYN